MFRDHFSPGCQSGHTHAEQRGMNAAEPLCCAPDTFLPKRTDYMYFCIIPTTSFMVQIILMWDEGICSM